MSAPAALPEALRARLARRRAVVLGAGGFIGAHVAAALARAGAQVLRVVRPGGPADGDALALDLAAAEAAGRVAALAPAFVFNLAGYGVDAAEREAAPAEALNAQLPGRLADALSGSPGAAALRVVHVGSALEYGRAGGDLSEETACAPDTLYGRSKLAGSLALAAACRRSGLRGVTARLFTVYGPGEHAQRLLPSLCRAARTDAPLELTAGLQRRDFTHVDDVVEGLLRLALADCAPGEIVNLATGRLTPVREFAEEVARQLGIPAERLHFGALPTRGEEMCHAPVSIARLAQRCGWTPGVTVAEGVRRSIAGQRGDSA